MKEMSNFGGRLITIGNYIIKIFFSILFLFISYILLLALNSPTNHYEASIYSATPIIFFWIIFLSIFFSLVILLLNIFYFHKKIYSILSLLLIALSSFSCIILFFIRSYYFFGLFEDPTYHIGAIKLIIQNQNIVNIELVYPFLHIFSVEFYYLTNIELIELSKIIPIILNFLFFVFFILLINESLNKSGEKLIAIAFGFSLIVASALFTPNNLLNLYSPFIFYIFLKSIKSSNKNWSIVLLLMTIITPLIHPLGIIYFFIIVSSFMLYIIISSKLLNLKQLIKKPLYTFKNILKNNKIRINIILLAISIIWSIFWLSQFHIYDWTINNIYLSSIGHSDENSFTNLVMQVNYANSFGLNLYELFVKQVGTKILIIFLSFLGLIYYHIYESKNIINENLQIFQISFISFIFITGILVIFKLPFGALRLLTPAIMIGVILSSHFLFVVTSYKPENYKKILLFIIFIVITIEFFLGIMTFYPSSYTHLMNPQTSHAEETGYEWYFKTQNDHSIPTGITAAPGRAAEFIIPAEQILNNTYPLYLEGDRQPPKHFGYTNNYSLGESYKNEKGIIILKRDKLRFSEILPEMSKTQWNLNDFNRLENDRSINRIYVNGDFEYSLIEPIDRGVSL